MPNLDAHIPALRARTLTAATVRADTALDDAERLALLVSIGVLDPLPPRPLKTIYVEAATQIGVSSELVVSTLIGAGKLQSVEFEILTNSEALNFGSEVDGNNSETPDVGVIFSHACKAGEFLDDTYKLIVPAHAVTASDYRYKITYLPA